MQFKIAVIVIVNCKFLKPLCKANQVWQDVIYERQSAAHLCLSGEMFGELVVRILQSNIKDMVFMIRISFIMASSMKHSTYIYLLVVVNHLHMALLELVSVQ